MQRSIQKQKERKQRIAHTPKSIQLSKSEDVNMHPSVPVMDNYCFHQERLSMETIEKVESHLSICKRCREDTDHGTVNTDYFRRLEKAPIDC